MQIIVKLPKKSPDPEKDPPPQPTPPPKSPPPKPSPGKDSSPDSICQCYGKWVDSTWRDGALAACRHSLGDRCLGYEVRWQKRYRYSPAKGACVGAYQGWKHYLHPPQDPKPTWFNDYACGENRPVSLSQARNKCRELKDKKAAGKNKPSAEEPGPNNEERGAEPDRSAQENEITAEELFR